MSDYDVQRGLTMLAHYESDAENESNIAEALRSHADEHERSACNAELHALKLRERLIADGHLAAEVHA